jgi:hypothetical protein
MSLRKKQSLFVKKLALLIEYAYDQGYELTLSRGYASPAANAADGGHPNSLHTKRLAIDLNLFKDGEYLTRTEDHRPLGEFWESIGGTWGGRFNDGNHYSLEHQGMK